MRIAQVSPLIESVPPVAYGGTERVVHWLCEELVQQGHDVTLFASGDSTTSARLVPCATSALRRGPGGITEAAAVHVAMLDRVYDRAEDFDVIHCHVDYLHFPLSARAAVPTLTTLHGRLDLPNIRPCYRRFAWLPFCSISDAQREPMPWLNWRGTVHHGMDTDLFSFSPRSEGYLLFLGRISPEKRCDRAIEIATRAGKKLLIAAKVDGADHAYFHNRIEPLLRRHPGVEFLGEVGDREKRSLLAGADALLFPIDWPEPFGLVMIEALASGTPVIATPCGSVPEVLDDGVTGYLVRTLEEAVAAVERVPMLSRARCREAFERRFSPRRMASDYLRIYHALAREEPVHDLVATKWRGRGRAGGRPHSDPAGL